MTRRTVQQLVGTLVLAIALGLSSCAGDGDEPSGPTPTPLTPTRTPGATPTPLTPTRTPGATPTPGAVPTPTPTAGGGAITIAADIESPGGFALAAGEGGFLAVFAAAATDQSSQIFGVRLGGDGSVIDAEPFLVSVATSDPQLDWSSPTVGFDGSTYAVAYAGSGDLEGAPVTEITAVLVDAQKNVGMPATLAQTVGIGTCQEVVGPPPEIAGTAQAGFAVLWPLDAGCAGGPMFQQVQGAFAAPNGTSLSSMDIEGLLPSNGGAIVASSAGVVAASAAATLAAWSEAELTQTSSPTTIEVALLAPGSAPERSALAAGPSTFVPPAVASDGSDFLVVWGSGPNAPFVLRGARFRPDVGPLDGADGFVIASSDAAQGAPEIAFAGGVYTVIWTTPESSGSEFQLNAVAVTPEGGVGTPTVLATGLDGPGAAIAGDGEVLIAAFLRAGAGGASSLDAVIAIP